MKWMFYNSKWSKGYGGKAWGRVADCLVKFVAGEFTAEMMLDTNWALAHNNGPIFNKGIFYQYHTPMLKKILDIQRSGQIPEAIIEDNGHVSEYVTPEIFDHASWLKTRFPASIGDYVDWYKVEHLGAVQSYTSDKIEQSKKYGLSPFADPQNKKKPQKIENEKVDKSYFEIMPGIKVKKFIRAV